MDPVSQVQAIFKHRSFDSFDNDGQFLEAAMRISALGKLEFKSMRQRSQIEALVADFNSCWIEILLKQQAISTIKGKKVNVVEFSFCHKGMHWLSNFFPTLIFDPTRDVILPAVEHGYVWYKAVSNADGEELTKEEVFDLLSKTSKEAKQWGASYIRQDDDKSIAEMTRLVTLKFKQSPKLNTLLKGSAPARLEEATADMFWGTGFGAGGKNALGDILGNVRQL